MEFLERLLHLQLAGPQTTSNSGSCTKHQSFFTTLGDFDAGSHLETNTASAKGRSRWKTSLCIHNNDMQTERNEFLIAHLSRVCAWVFVRVCVLNIKHLPLHPVDFQPFQYLIFKVC
jgi:hypothetical protein